jgi:tetratricopeptide (TPR) repeat protein
MPGAGKQRRFPPSGGGKFWNFWNRLKSFKTMLSFRPPFAFFCAAMAVVFWATPPPCAHAEPASQADSRAIPDAVARPFDADFNTANALYDRADFAGAQAAYERLVKAGHRRANLFYNLGNAAHQGGQKSAAFLAYERALALEPGHPEAAANLRALRGETGARLETPTWAARLLGWPGKDGAAWLAAIAFWGMAFSIAPVFWRRKIALPPAIVGALLLIWSGSAIVWQNARGPLWIVTADNATARTAPAENAATVAALPMGSRVQLLLDRGPWLCVRLPGEARGWLLREAASPVNLGEARPGK